MNIKPAIICAAVLLAGCTPTAYESPYVYVATPSGTVTCQLYTREIIAFDRSVNRPETMTVLDADNLCHAEGLERLREFKGYE